MREMSFLSPSFADGLICQEEHFIMEPVVNEAIATRINKYTVLHGCLDAEAQ
jgi:hypothetical protein